MFAQATILGRVCQDVSTRMLHSGQVAQIRLATNRKFNTAQGLQERTLYIDCDCFGKNAEVALNYVRKGELVLVSGELRQDTYTSLSGKNAGQEITKTYIAVDNLRLMPKTFNGKDTTQAQPQAVAQPQAGVVEIPDDEIPF